MSLLLLRRLAQTIPTLLLAAVLTFSLLQVAPGGPASAIAGDDASPEILAQIEAELGLDRPVHVQFRDWLTSAAQGDFGASLVNRVPVSEDLSRAAPLSLELAVIALIIAVSVGIPLGILTAVRRRTLLDEVFRGFSGLGIAVPQFWLAMVAIYIFALKLGWFPSGGFVEFSEGLGGHIESILLPVTVLATSGAAILTRQTRSAMMRALDSDYILAARAAGVRPRDLYLKLALRNALIPVVTVVGLVASSLIGGTVLLERVFVMPGLGTLLINSAVAKDFPVTQGVMMVLVVLILLINLAVDLSYGLLDPRTRRR